MSAPRHILMVLDHAFPPDLRVENEARTLKKAGYNVTVLAIGPDSRKKNDDFDGGRIVRDRIWGQIRNKMRGLAGTVGLLDLYLMRRLRTLHRQCPIDAIHAHDLYLFGACIRAGKKLKIPVVGDMHENWVEALKHYKWSTSFPGKLVVNIQKWDRLELEWSAAVDHLIVVIEEMADRLRQRGISDGHMSVVPNTVNLDEFSSWPLEQLEQFRALRPRILYTGGMDLHRGLEDPIRAMPRILESIPDAELILVGDGAARRELESLTGSLGLDDHVRFEGWQEQSRVKSFMAHADIGLIPHKKTEHTDHTIPHKLFHYMHMRLPCMVSNCLPLQRIVSETGCGRIYTSGSSEELASGLINLLQDDGERARMGNAGFVAVRDHYNWDATAGGLVTAYQQLFSPERRSGESLV